MIKNKPNYKLALQLATKIYAAIIDDGRKWGYADKVETVCPKCKHSFIAVIKSD